MEKRMTQRSPGSYLQAVPLRSQYILFSHSAFISTFNQPASKWVCLNNKLWKHQPIHYPIILPSTHLWVLSFLYTPIQMLLNLPIPINVFIIHSLSPFIQPSYFICIIYQVNPSIHPLIPLFIFPFIHPIPSPILSIPYILSFHPLIFPS